MEVSMVPPQLVNTCWTQIEPFMKKAAKYTYGRFTSDDIYDSVVEHDYQLWVAYENKVFKGAVVTNVMVYPKRKLLCMSFCGGYDLKEWKEPMLSLLQRYAKDMGCDGIEATARAGWAKIFLNDGYKQHWVTFELPL
jgi:hypothetical protein